MPFQLLLEVFIGTSDSNFICISHEKDSISSPVTWGKGNLRRLTLYGCLFCLLLYSLPFHRGYIPTTKLPSSKRAQTTHERLCQHETIARTAKECCSVPEMLVKSSIPGEVLQREPENNYGGHISPNENGATVADIAGELCDNFDEWAREHYLHDVREDWGWFELTSQAYN